MKFEAIKTLDGELQIRTVIPNMEGFPVATVHPERVQTASGDMRERDDMETARLLAAAPDLLGLAKEARQFEVLTGENLAVFTRTFAALAANYVRKVERGGE